MPQQTIQDIPLTLEGGAIVVVRAQILDQRDGNEDEDGDGDFEHDVEEQQYAAKRCAQGDYVLLIASS